MSRVASVYLSKAERDRFNKVCEKEGCTPYSLVKKTLMDHIWAYPLEKAPPSEKEDLNQELGKVTEVEPTMGAEAVSESVRRILEGKKSE